MWDVVINNIIIPTLPKVRRGNKRNKVEYVIGLNRINIEFCCHFYDHPETNIKFVWEEMMRRGGGIKNKTKNPYPNKDDRKPLEDPNFFSASCISCMAFCSLSAMIEFRCMTRTTRGWIKRVFLRCTLKSSDDVSQLGRRHSSIDCTKKRQESSTNKGSVIHRLPSFIFYF